MTIPEQAVQAEILWAVNIHGPDDLVAAPDYLSAVRMSNAFNAWWLNLKMKQPHNDAIDARMWAVPTDWPENYAQEHAYELSKPHPEYQWLRDASATPHLAAVRVKKLEWRDNEHGSRCTTDPRCYISVWMEGGKPLYVDNYTTMRRFGTLEEAKAAAQADFEARILSALEPSETIETYYARQIEWSKNTFGPALRTKGIIDHIKKELKEIEAEPHDLSEWIDVVILAMDGFWRHGGTVDDLMVRLLAKQQKNMARTWPDWRTMSEDAAIEHDRTKDVEPSAGRAAVLEEAARVAFDVSENGKYHGEASVDSASSIYQQGAYEVYEAIRALVPHPVADKPDEAGAQGEGWLPIESAPKDTEKPYLCYSPGNKSAHNEYARFAHYHIDGFSERWPKGRNQYPEAPYTHWRHLPTPPSSEVA